MPEWKLRCYYLVYRLACWLNGWQARDYLRWRYYDAYRWWP